MNFNELCESILTAQEEMLKHNIEANSVTLNGRKYGKLLEFLPPNVKPTIFGMALKADYALPDDYDFLVQSEPPKPKTNADRIRSMPDEELAEWIAYGLRRCPHYGEDDYQCDSCAECWAEWMKQEAKDDSIP